jgi:hypothetical protein
MLGFGSPWQVLQDPKRQGEVREGWRVANPHLNAGGRETYCFKLVLDNS